MRKLALFLMLFLCTLRSAGAAELSYILQDLRCLPMTRSALGDGDCPVEQNSVVIAGSMAMVFYIELLAREFEKRNPGIKVEVAGGSSIAGLIAVERGAIDLAAISRDLTPKEYRPELKVTMIGRDALAVVAHHDNPVSDLTRDQLRAIFMGELTRWPGSGLPVHVITREPGAPSLQSFRELALANEEVTSDAEALNDVKDVTAAVAADPDAIGFLGLYALSPEVKALSINGVTATNATILSSRYPLMRSLNLIELTDEANPSRQRFIEFAISPAGQRLIEKAGDVRVY
jgi:phosphate transport system substrate-binding protein